MPASPPWSARTRSRSGRTKSSARRRRISRWRSSTAHALTYAFVDAHHGIYGVEPICRVLRIAPSGYHEHRLPRRAPERRGPRARREDVLRADVRRAHRAHREVCGARKVWRQLRREGVAVARCTVGRLMRAEGLRGVVRGAPVRTTRSAEDREAAAQDLVQRQFSATRPNQLCVADFAYVATRRGFVYVAFVVDVFSRRILGWRAHTTMRTELVLDALDQVLHDRELDGQLAVHSDRGSQMPTTEPVGPARPIRRRPSCSWRTKTPSAT